MDFADKRPPPKTTAQAFELAFDPEGDNVFVLSALFPQAFGRKLKEEGRKASRGGGRRRHGVRRETSRRRSY